MKSFIEFINENSDGRDQFIRRLAQKLVDKLRTSSMEESTDYSSFLGMEFIEPFTFDLVLNARKEEFPKFEKDSHFKDLPWEKLNFSDLGYSIDANVKMSRSSISVPVITIQIILNPKKEPILYSKLYYRLIDILTHETNHLNQLGLNREPFNSHVSSKIERTRAKKSSKYFLLKDEIESMVEGMYQRSKEQNISLDQVFNEYLSPFIKTKYISRAEYLQVMNAWVTQALQKYPDAVFSNKVDYIVNSI